MRISTSEFLFGSLNDLLSQEGTVNQLNRQISTGQSMLGPMDDPAGAGLALGIANQIDQLKFDSNNAEAGAQTIQEGLSVLQSVTNVINRVRQTAVQAANGTTNAADRQSLVGVVQGALQELIQLANTQLPDGRYIFGGSKSNAEPFQILASGQTVFNGDGGANSIEIAPSLAVPVTISGQGIFMDVPDGNGSFAVAASGANTGGGVAVPSGVTSASQIAAEHLAGTQFQITFTAAGAGGSLNYTVTSGSGAPGSPGFIASSGTVASGAFTPGADIGFGGMDVRIDGTPAVGDSFMVRTSQNSSMFATLQNLVTALQMPQQGPGAQALAQQQMQTVLSGLDAAQTSILSAQAALGTSLSEIQTVRQQDSAIGTTDQAQLSNLQTVNLPEVITRFNEGITSLQAAEQTFGRIQNLTLFSVIKA